VLVKQFSLNVDAPAVPGLSLGPVPEAVGAAQQLTLDLNLDNAYPLPVTGEIRLRFLPDAAIGADDPAIQFSNGGRAVAFTIAANSTRPDSQIALQTGTVAGTIELNVTLQGGLGVSRSITISRLAPSIRNLKMVRTPAGFELRATGFSNTREMTNATVRFAGASLQTTEVLIPLNELARSWYQSNASRPFGSQFSLTLPFSIQGSLSAIQSATLVITNAQGSSAPVIVDFGP
jgi:hypothetical protein